MEPVQEYGAAPPERGTPIKKMIVEKPTKIMNVKELRDLDYIHIDIDNPFARED
jgi:hypothetical protein